MGCPHREQEPVGYRQVVLLPDAGPLITLAYADALDLLLEPGWSLALVDMVLHEVTRNKTPTSNKLAEWSRKRQVKVLSTRTIHALSTDSVPPPRKRNLGELAIQEVMTGLVLESPSRTGVFLFEDHKIARAGFFLPDNCRKVSTRAFLLFLENRGGIQSAAAIERRAVRAGRRFSRLHFPPHR
ncbi:hypothetical protein [Candidatus Thiosymbion oneisti]|uniref:hypothetical protein n=1 Tax=Candidatus Thiosymbion oneisti TaxID=589554 RepID=UPI00105FA1F3|nr:hypothetical protein [Candidatus Thiosymbion oneisti]